MPLLASLVLKLFTAILAFFGAYLTKQIAMRLALLTLFIALTGSMVIALKALISSIAVTIPAEVQAASFILPSNTSTCIAAYWSARVLRWVYDSKLYMASARLF